MDLHLHISAGRDKNGCIKVDCHWGTETVFPHGFATCISDDDDLDTFFQKLREDITEEVEDPEVKEGE